jgi:hypothetical protein
MEFKPKSREEIEKDADERKREMNRKSLLKPGIYDFEVMRAEDQMSSKGNKMIKLKLRVFHDGGEAHMYDYLVANQEAKVAAYCDSVGKSEQYDAGDIKAEDMAGDCGRAKIGIEDEKPKDDGTDEKWPAKNKIKDYLPKSEKDGGRKVEKPEEPPAASGDDLDDLKF